MSRCLNLVGDLALAVWMALVAAQYLTGVVAAVWHSPSLDARPDLRAGYWVLGGLFLLGAAFRHARPAPEVAHDR